MSFLYSFAARHEYDEINHILIYSYLLWLYDLHRLTLEEVQFDSLLSQKYIK